MLRIDRIEIHGFKSFCDRTELRFWDGITAIVGPNGCGKSNIADAIHWVMGEQSARTLRGGKMEDVIFAGTESRGPHGMAEVSLHLRASDGKLPSGEQEAILTRRLFRSGECEYLLDGRRVRLRDIQDLLHSVHVGATTYAVIEQGKIEALLSAKPRERRQLIEEAAGIIGYKQKRHLAELKLQATEANLLRIRDVIQEVRRQIESLKRQAARARRYRGIQDELRAAEGRLFSAKARALRAALERLRGVLAECQASEAEASAALASNDARMEACRESKRRLDAEISSAREEVHRLAREIDRDESAIAVHGQRAAELRRDASRLAAQADETISLLEAERGERCRSEQSLAALDAEVAAAERQCEDIAREESDTRRHLAGIEVSLASRRQGQLASASRLAEASNTAVHLDRELKRLQAQRQRLGGEKADAEGEASGLVSRLAAADRENLRASSLLETSRLGSEEARRIASEREARLRGLNESIVAARETLARLDERVRSLEDIETRLAGVTAGARWLLSRDDRGPVRGVVADFVEVDRQSEAAIEAYLGAYLGAVVVPTADAAVSLVAEISQARAGRCMFVPEDAPAAPAAALAAPPDLAGEPTVLGVLSEFASSGNGIAGKVAGRLSGAILARDLESALDLARRYPGRDYATPAGEVVGRDGTIEGGGGGSSEAGLLARRRLLESTRAERAIAAAGLLEQERERDLAERACQEARLERERADRDSQDAGTEAALALERCERLRGERARVERRLEVIAKEISAIDEEIDAIAERIGWAEGERREAESEASQAARTLDADQREAERLRGVAERCGEVLAGRRQELAAMRERRRHAAGEIARLAAEMEERRSQADADRRAAEAAVSNAVAEDLLAAEKGERLGAVLASHAAVSGRLSDAQESAREREEEILRLEDRARASRSNLDERREARRQAETAAAVAEADMRHLEERSRTELGRDLGELVSELPEEPYLDSEELERRILELRSKLESLGPVNLLAIEEFQELEERQRFLLKQEADLTGSIESLKETIRRINRTSREMFLEAFEGIRRNFSETFRLLFGGGRADIRLMEEEDPLECGLEINVQPPGKRLQSLMLLSGGEKALSAIALLFAIFRYQPSPFCLLDEADAALDESNVRRFTRLLGQFSAGTQFIVITHNKRSMEAANTLYGVTMEEAGISRIVSMSLPEGASKGDGAALPEPGRVVSRRAALASGTRTP